MCRSHPRGARYKVGVAFTFRLRRGGSADSRACCCERVCYLYSFTSVALHRLAWNVRGTRVIHGPYLQKHAEVCSSGNMLTRVHDILDKATLLQDEQLQLQMGHRLVGAWRVWAGRASGVGALELQLTFSQPSHILTRTPLGLPCLSDTCNAHQALQRVSAEARYLNRRHCMPGEVPRGLLHHHPAPLHEPKPPA